jgi:hypothetical protein
MVGAERPITHNTHTVYANPDAILIEQRQSI